MMFFPCLTITPMTDPLALPDSGGPRAVFLCGKSWTAYAGTFVIAVLLFFAALPLAFRYNARAALIVLIGSALIVGYRLLTIRSHQLYYDEAGVWLASGILPWKKKLAGVAWRDMGQAAYDSTFWSWLLRALHGAHQPAHHAADGDPCQQHGKRQAGRRNAQCAPAGDHARPRPRRLTRRPWRKNLCAPAIDATLWAVCGRQERESLFVTDIIRLLFN